MRYLLAHWWPQSSQEKISILISQIQLLRLSEKVWPESPIFNLDEEFRVITAWDRKRFKKKIKMTQFKNRLLRNLNWLWAKSAMMNKVWIFLSWVNKKRRKLPIWIQKTPNLLIWAKCQKNRTLEDLIKMRKIQKRRKRARKMRKSLPNQNLKKKKTVLSFLKLSLKKLQIEVSDGDWEQFISASLNWLIQRSQNGKTRKILRIRKVQSMLIQHSKCRRVWIN